MRLQAHHSTIAVLLERSILPYIIDDPASHLHPFILTVGTSDYVLAVHIADPIFRKMGVAIRIGCLTATSGIAGIPVEFEVGRPNRSKRARRFGSSGGITSSLILQQQRDAVFACLVGSLN